MKRDFIKPLIIMTPKSLLRAEFSTSRAEDFIRGNFHEIIPDSVTAVVRGKKPDKTERVILCCGKVYFDLVSHREKEKISNAAIIRIEQLYPLDETQLRAAVEAFPKKAQLIWCQEEPQNMGAWTFIEPRLRALFKREVGYAGRGASASPAVGALALHKREQACLIGDAFSIWVSDQTELTRLTGLDSENLVHKSSMILSIFSGALRTASPARTRLARCFALI